MCSAIATPTAPFCVSREDAQRFILGVERWIWRLAGRYCGRLRMPLEDLAAEIMSDVFEHLADYNPDRGRPTTWVNWRARYVVMNIRRIRRLKRVVRAVPFSQMAEAFEGQAGDVLAVARHDSDAETGRLEREEDAADLRAGMRAALGFLAPGHEADLKAYYGLDDDDQEHDRERD